MKSLNITLFAAFLALSPLASGGEVYCTPCASKDICVDKTPICHSPTGYIFAYGGMTFANDFDGNEPDFPSVDQYETDTGYIVGGGVGIYSCLLDGSRFEIEGLYSASDITTIQSDLLDGNGFQNFGLNGAMHTKAVMANLVKEIPVCGLTAFVGGGIGYAENEITYNNPALDFSTNTSDGALAWQFIAGVDVPVAACLDFFVQYKLLGIEDTEYLYVDERVNIDSFVTHNLVFGGRVSF